MKTVSGVLGALLIAVIAVLAFGSSDRGEVGATEAPPALAAIGSSAVVSLVTPAPHSLEANPDSPVELVLTEALDPERFDPAALSVFGRWSGVMTGSVELSDDGRRLRFDPGAPFHAGETVTASLRAGEKLETGGAMETGFAWSFWIRPRAGSLDMVDRGARVVLDDGEKHVQPYGAYAGDFNGDGYPDIAIPNEVSADVRVMFNDGKGDYNEFRVLDIPGDGRGNLELGSRVRAGGKPWMIVSGDVNGDGNVDVMSANREGNNVGVLIGDGRGGFAEPVEYETGDSPLAVDVGDIDGDGDLDVVTSDFEGNSFTVHENAGDGTLVNPRSYPASTNGSCVVIHDRDLDGDLDLTGVDETDDMIFILENPGR